MSGNWTTYIIMKHSDDESNRHVQELMNPYLCISMSSMEVRRLVRSLLKTKRLPSIWRSLDVLQVLGYKVFEPVENTWTEYIRLPKHLKPIGGCSTIG